jgi:TraM recognition site of TraD and TraG
VRHPGAGEPHHHRPVPRYAAFQHYHQSEHLWGAEAAELIFSGTTSLFFSDCGDREVTTRLSELSGHGGPRPGGWRSWVWARRLGF